MKMYCHGFCYGGMLGKAGFKIGGFGPLKKVKSEIQQANIGWALEYRESGGKFRAWRKLECDEFVPTGYVYFPIVETYTAVRADGSFLKKGELEDCKKYVVKECGHGKFIRHGKRILYYQDGYLSAYIV